MSAGGMAAFGALNELLVSMLWIAATLVIGLLGLWVSAWALRAGGWWLVRRRRARRVDAAVHAEAKRGIDELERYLGRRDAAA